MDKIEEIVRGAIAEDGHMKAVAREIAEKIAADARMRLICMKPDYDTIDLGESLILAAMREVGRPETVTDELIEALERIEHEGQQSADTYGCANCNRHAEIAREALFSKPRETS